MMNRSPDKHEAAMARADLYKLANYSMKLFKMIQEGQELEGWVQAKITKAADYVASVYHFMEYEMKVSDYGSKLENSDVYSESVRRAFQQKLMEAKKKAEKVKQESEKMDEGFEDMQKWLKDKNGPQPSGGSGVKKGSRYGGSKQKADDTDKDDDDEKPTKSKKVKEAAKPDYLDFDKDGNKKEPMKKALKDKKVKEDSKLSELKKSTLGSYVKKASKDAVKKTRDADAEDEYGDPDEGDKLDKKAQKRMAGVNKAVDKLTKEAAMSPAPAQKKSGIPSTATTTVPGMKATQQDLKKANSSAALGESKCNHTPKGKSCPVHGLKECGSMSEAVKKGLYYNVNKRKAAGTSRDKDHPKAPSAQDWKNAAKTAKK
jgi:hypothetical protein